MTSISLEDFKLFYLAKSYDVIGLGSFRRHVCKCKEAGDPWAVEMNAGVNRIQQTVRALQARISQIPKPRNALLQQLCKDVMVGAQPPIRMYAGYTTCCLSGVSCNTCIDLTRPAKNSQHVHIHARFSHFFLMLWYCSKLEYVVRSCAKAWLERQVDREDKSFKELCEKFEDETTEYCCQLHGVLTRSYNHVGKTLDLLMHYALEHRVLDHMSQVKQSEDTKACTYGTPLFKTMESGNGSSSHADMLRVVEETTSAFP
jgi:hypothetical protein